MGTGRFAPQYLGSWKYFGNIARHNGLEHNMMMKQCMGKDYMGARRLGESDGSGGSAGVLTGATLECLESCHQR